jgi:hypothetical protein
MNKKKTPIQFALLTIEMEQFAIFEDQFTAKKETSLSTELQFKLDQHNKQIGVFVGVEFLQGKKIFLKIQVSCHFKINEPSWSNFVTNKASKLIIPKQFLAHLAMITTGTTRGILFAKTESTKLATFILPTINVSEMIADDALFEFFN